MATALSPTMTLRDFEHGYWYREQSKDFAGSIGIPAATKLRKDELQKAIVVFLRTGDAVLPTKRSLRRTGTKDVERGLSLKRRIENYTSNRETKNFIIVLNKMQRFKRIPIACYNNFVGDFLAANKKATRAEVIAAWTELKKLDVPNDYASWVKTRAKRKERKK